MDRICQVDEASNLYQNAPGYVRQVMANSAAKGRDWKSQLWANKFNSLMENNPKLAQNADTAEDAFEEIDTQVRQIAQERMGFTDALRERNLTKTGGNLGITISKIQNIDDGGGAQQSMSLNVQGNRNQAEYSTSIYPVPVTHADVQFDLRQQLANQRKNFDLRSDSVDQATRDVMETIEDANLDGSGVTLTIGGTQVTPDGVRTHSNRVTGSLTAVWTDANNRDILGDVRSMKGDAQDANHYGPFRLEVPGNYDTVLDEDYKAESEMSYREKILSYNQIDEVEVNDHLPDDEVVLVQMSSDNLDLRVVEDLTVVPWGENPWTSNFKVLAAMVLRIKPDDNGNLGIVHYT